MAGARVGAVAEPEEPRRRWLLLAPASALAEELCRAAGGLEGWCAGAARSAGRSPPAPGAGLLAGPAPEWTLRLGRGVRATQGVRLPAEWVHCSGSHAEVAWSEPTGGYVLRDLSTNGTFCGKERPSRYEEVALRGGEAVSFVSGLGGDITEDGVVRFHVELIDLDPLASASPSRSPSGRAREPASGGIFQQKSTRKRPISGANTPSTEGGGAGEILTTGKAEAKAMAALERANRELRQKLELERSRAETLNTELLEVTMKTDELREKHLIQAQTEELRALETAQKAGAVAEQLAEALAQAEAARNAAAAERREREAAQKAARAAHREMQAKEAQIAHLELSLETEVARSQEKHAEAKSVLLAAEARLEQVVMEARAAGAQAEAAAQKLHALSDAAERARGALQDWEQNIPTQPQTQRQGEPLKVPHTQFQHESPVRPGGGMSLPAARAETTPQSQPQVVDLDQTEELTAPGIAGSGDRPILAEKPAHPVPGVLPSVATAVPDAAPSFSPGPETAADPLDVTKSTRTRVLSQGAEQTLNTSQGGGDATMAADPPLKEGSAGALAPQDAATDMDVENMTPVEGA